MENEKIKEKVKGNPVPFVLFRLITVAIIIIAIIFIKFVFPSAYKSINQFYNSDISADMSAETLLSEEK